MKINKVLTLKVLNVNTMSVKGKEVRRGKTTGKTSDWKKAIVTIGTNPGDIKYFYFKKIGRAHVRTPVT